jgi:integrase
MKYQACASVQPRPHRMRFGPYNCQFSRVRSLFFFQLCISILTPQLVDTETEEEVPYCLAACQALCDYWHIPFNYVISKRSMPCMAMQFSPVLEDPSWKGTFSFKKKKKKQRHIETVLHHVDGQQRGYNELTKAIRSTSGYGYQCGPVDYDDI